MIRPSENFFSWSLFDNAAEIHDGDAVGHLLVDNVEEFRGKDAHDAIKTV